MPETGAVCRHALAALAIVFAALAAPCLADPTGADDAGGQDRLLNIKTGHLRVDPTLTVKERYDSNITLTDVAPQDDWITIVSPGVDLDYYTDKFQGNVSYRAESLSFNDHDENDFVQHFLNGGFRWKPGRVFLGTGGSYQLTSDPLNLVLTPRLEIEQDSLYGVGGVDWDRFSIEVQGTRRNFDIQVSDFNFLDYDQEEISLTAGYKVNEKWRIIATLLGGWTDYNEDLKNSYAYQEYALGAHWCPCERFALRADVGFRKNDYDSSILPLFTQDYEDVIARVTLLWKPCENGTATIAYHHRPEESVETNFITTDRLIMSYEHAFSAKWKARADGSYEHSEESAGGVPQETKEGFSGGITVTFNILKWLSTDVGYLYREKDTNDGTGEFIDHMATFGVTARF